MKPPLLPIALRDFRAGLRRPRAELAALQFERLRALVTFAYERVPFYRSRYDSVGFHPRHLKSGGDIVAIPTIDRTDIQRASPEQLLAPGYSPERMHAARSAGSSASPVLIYRSREEVYCTLIFRMRAWRHIGLRPTDHVMTISGLPSTGRRRRWLRRLPLPWRWNVSLLDPELAAETFRIIKPSVLYGYSFRVAMLARVAAEQNLSHRLRIVATSGDLLPQSFRETIRSAWGVDPIQIYSSTEAADAGWQCALRQGYHINADETLVEILRDGVPAADGEMGEITITPLYRYGMPLIRYLTADLATGRDELCPCGVTLPMIDSLEGRTLSILPLPGGRTFIGFNRMMSNAAGVGEYQVVQEALDRVRISVVPGRGFTPEGLDALAREARQRLGADVHVEVKVAQSSELIRTTRKPQPILPFERVDLGNRHLR